jgi:hypothetical protein
MIQADLHGFCLKDGDACARAALNYTGKRLFVTSRSVTERTTGSESTEPMTGMLRRKPLRARDASRTSQAQPHRG